MVIGRHAFQFLEAVKAGVPFIRGFVQAVIALGAVVVEAQHDHAGIVGVTAKF